MNFVVDYSGLQRIEQSHWQIMGLVVHDMSPCQGMFLSGVKGLGDMSPGFYAETMRMQVQSIISRDVIRWPHVTVSWH
jgi:hypothetical protein